MLADTWVRQLCIPAGGVLRIDRARGIRVRAASGRVWITEHGRRDDVVLVSGESTMLTRWGRAIVSAWGASRIVLEIPRFLAWLRSIELAPAEGTEHPAVRITLPHVDELRQAAVARIRHLLGRMRETPAALGSLEIARRIRLRARRSGAEMPDDPDTVRRPLWLDHPGIA